MQVASQNRSSASGSPRALFLHGGPGGSAQLERAWFGTALPIEWWDQPRLTMDAARPLRAISSAGVEKIIELTDAAGDPIALVAHSFGGRVALAIANELPERVCEVVLISCGAHLPSQVVRLGRATARDHPGDKGLEQALRTAEQRNDLDSLLALITVVTSTPQWVRQYFGAHSDEVRSRYCAVAPNGPDVDPATFVAVLREQLATPSTPTESRFGGRVALWLGAEDPLLDIHEETAFWRSSFPAMDISVVPGGHMLHLELPYSRWGPNRLQLSGRPQRP